MKCKYCYGEVVDGKCTRCKRELGEDELVSTSIGQWLADKHAKRFEKNILYGYAMAVRDILTDLDQKMLGGTAKVETAGPDVLSDIMVAMMGGEVTPRLAVITEDDDCPAWCIYPTVGDSLYYYSIGAIGSNNPIFDIREYKFHPIEGLSNTMAREILENDSDDDDYEIYSRVINIFNLNGDIAPTLEAIYEALEKVFENLK